VDVIGVYQARWQKQLDVNVIVMTRGYCCFQCGHCTDEIIAEMMECKCKCHG